MSKYIHEVGGKVCLNVSLATVGASKSKVLASKSKANLIVCDLSLMKEVIHKFTFWKRDVLSQSQQQTQIVDDGTVAQVL